ncbi:MAG: hypothetical protein NC350_01035 [Corallococcus sp.]|nr:hypothetical protein [Corallococcus sp.]
MKTLLEVIANEGRQHKSSPHLKDVDIFKPFFKGEELVDLDLQDASNCTRRELICRFLLLNAVLDQGPDMEGVRKLLADTLNVLYKKEIRILHSPQSFFNKLDTAVDSIDSIHDAIKDIRETDWQFKNKTKKHYNLFIEGTQTLSYAVFRWGTPLAVPLTLGNIDCDNPHCLIDFLKSFESSELMSQGIKSHKRYGLGKAIGNKAAHLFAKWVTYAYPLLGSDTDTGWGQYSYEVPFDSNAGRVLWRTGFLLHFVTEKELVDNSVIQIGNGKSGKNYLRITNCRGISVSQNVHEINKDIYDDLCINCLKVKTKRPKIIELQRIPAVLLYEGKNYSVGEFDDGLMYIGTNFCFNHNNPNCEECPLKTLCKGYSVKRLITEYST